jgi:hypothetical protein
MAQSLIPKFQAIRRLKFAKFETKQCDENRIDLVRQSQSAKPRDTFDQNESIPVPDGAE